MARRNLDLAFEVIRTVMATPRLAHEVDAFAAEGTLVLYDENDADLTAANDAMVTRMKRRGDSVTPLAMTRRVTLAPR